MSNLPTELKYAKSHEWARKESDGTFTVGITEHAQELLGDMVFVELPEVGDTVSAGEDCAVAESVKAASDIYSPISGEVPGNAELIFVALVISTPRSKGSSLLAIKKGLFLAGVQFSKFLTPIKKFQALFFL